MYNILKVLSCGDESDLGKADFSWIFVYISVSINSTENLSNRQIEED